MTYLIFCSFEVGGLPFAFAEVMNRKGVPTYYISLAEIASAHDSSSFHHGSEARPWDISRHFRQASERGNQAVVSLLREVREQRGIRAAFAVGDKAHLLSAAQIPYVYWSYGSDLDQICHPPIPNKLFSRAEWDYFFYCFRRRSAARASIRLASLAMIAPYQYKALDKVSTNKKLFFLPHVIASLELDAVIAQKTKARQTLGEKFDADDVFFSPTRHCWSGVWAKMSDNKGNDILIKAFATYLAKTNATRCKLVLVEKGPDVSQSKMLVRRLQVEHRIAWIPEMRREDLHQYYAGATAVFGQFGTPVLTGVALEPLAWATPSISYFSDLTFGVPYYDVLPPIVNAETVEELVAAMVLIFGSEEAKGYLSNAGWEWVRINCSEDRFVDRAQQTLDACAGETT